MISRRASRSFVNGPGWQHNDHNLKVTTKRSEWLHQRILRSIRNRLITLSGATLNSLVRKIAPAEYCSCEHAG